VTSTPPLQTLPRTSAISANLAVIVACVVFLRIWRTFPDCHFEILDIIGAGDSVVVRYKVTATHNGVGTLPVMGSMLVGVPATHKRFEVEHIHWYKLRDGKIVDHYAVRNDLLMMKQLGLLPTSARRDTK